MFRILRRAASVRSSDTETNSPPRSPGAQTSRYQRYQRSRSRSPRGLQSRRQGQPIPFNLEDTTASEAAARQEGLDNTRSLPDLTQLQIDETEPLAESTAFGERSTLRAPPGGLPPSRRGSQAGSRAESRAESTQDLHLELEETKAPADLSTSYRFKAEEETRYPEDTFWPDDTGELDTTVIQIRSEGEPSTMPANPGYVPTDKPPQYEDTANDKGFEGETEKSVQARAARRELRKLMYKQIGYLHAHIQTRDAARVQAEAVD